MSDDLTLAWVGRLKHGDLVAALQERGWNQADFARYMGWVPTKAGRVINLKWVPRTFTAAEEKKLLDLTGKLPDDLWPDWTRTSDWLDADKRATLTRRVSRHELAAAGGGRFFAVAPDRPDDALILDEQREQVRAVLETLTPREQRILRLRFGFDGDEPMTYEEIAEREAVTRVRIRQIEAKALKKLRHPSRLKKLRATGLVPEADCDVRLDIDADRRARAREALARARDTLATIDVHDYQVQR